MSIYSVLSYAYDLLDKWWFADKGQNPRDVINDIIPNEQCRVLDMCCGTFSNGLPIGKKNPNAQVVGLDRSEAMLREAKKKIKEANLGNAILVERDATNTGLPEKSFDYIIIGLVLHECREAFTRQILREAKRLLKDDGKLIVLEWDKQRRFSRKLKFAPLWLAEVLGNPKGFLEIYGGDKKQFFGRYGFEMKKKIDCNYTAVMVMDKGRLLDF